MTKPRLAVTVAILAGVAMLALTDCAKQAEKSPATQSISTRLKWLPGATYIGSIVAKEAGYWKDEGLDVSVYPGGFEADPIKLVAAGSNDFGITGADQLLQARANGVPIVAIFMELQKSPAGWMAMKSSGITKPQDFVGRVVGAAFGTNIEPTLDALLAKLAIKPSSLKRVPVKYDLSPLYSGQVDVFPVYLNGQPVQARLEGREVSTIDPADYQVQMYGNVYFTTEKMIRERPDVVQRFVRGLARGWAKSVSEPESSVDLLVRAEPTLKRVLELAILKATFPFIRATSSDTIGVMSDEKWRQTEDVMTRFGGMRDPVDVRAAYTNKFVVQASPKQGRE